MKHIERTLIVINSILGIKITIDDVQSVLGIVILSLQAILILYNVITKIIKHIKEKQIEKIGDELQQGIDDLNQLHQGDKDE